jgi:hypothetical protein
VVADECLGAAGSDVDAEQVGHGGYCWKGGSGMQGYCVLRIP